MKTNLGIKDVGQAEDWKLACDLLGEALIWASGNPIIFDDADSKTGHIFRKNGCFGNRGMDSDRTITRNWLITKKRNLKIRNQKTVQKFL